jgi:hypothetical protein
MSSAAIIARNLGARRQRNGWRCECPCGCGYDMTLAIGEEDRLLAYCFGGCEYRDILNELVQYGLLDPDDAELPHREPVVAPLSAEELRHKIESARWVYDRTAWDERISVYLRSRHIKLISSVLRFCDTAPHRLGVALPAMLAPVVDVNGAQTGIHMTYLRPNGSGKANLPKKFQRETRA